MFYFTCNESRIYESFTFWNNLKKKIHDILIYWDAPVYRLYIYIYIYTVCVCVCVISLITLIMIHYIKNISFP